MNYEKGDQWREGQEKVMEQCVYQSTKHACMKMS